jgi:uncharacterized lipoprotein YajG
MRIILALTTGVAIVLVAGCVQEPAVLPAAPPRAVPHVGVRTLKCVLRTLDRNDIRTSISG